MPRIPELPGVPIPHRSEQELWLKQHVARLCQLDHERFPGSQPVSFSTKDIAKLEAQDFWVCEKSDGIRVLLLVQTDLETSEQAIFLIDRHNSYRHVSGLFFPHHEFPTRPLRNTLVDGELVVDVDPQTNREVLRYLVFDGLVVDDQNVMTKTLDKRYGRVQEWFYKPYSKMMKDHPHMAQSQPFEIKVKLVRMSYHVDAVFGVDIPALHHGNDGLIYTCVSTPYSPGTDPNIMKWKPPSENSIDFKLVLRFPSEPARPSKPDYFAKPIFELHVWCGDRHGQPQYEMYDIMQVDDDEWEKMKETCEQFDDRIVEVHWDKDRQGWRMMRFRDDKPAGNHKSVVENIIKSIADGVEKENLLSHSTSIRNAWKSREGQPQSQAPPSSHQPHALPPKPHPAAAPPPTSLPARPSPSSHPQRSGSGPPAPIFNGPEPKAMYGPIASSPWSKVAGPRQVGGMYR